MTQHAALLRAPPESDRVESESDRIGIRSESVRSGRQCLPDAELTAASDLALDDLTAADGLASGTEADLLQALGLGVRNLEFHIGVGLEGEAG